MSATAIEWATHVWNPFTGCDRISPGCAHCYAVAVAASLQRQGRGRAEKAEREGKRAPVQRYTNDGDPRTSGPGFGFTVHWDKLENPERFPAGSRVFVNSMSDVFHEQAPDIAIAKLFAACAAQPWANFLILTKRPERMRDLLRSDDFKQAAGDALLADHGPRLTERSYATWPLPNVWLGVTIENRRFVHRAHVLRATPAAVRFISAEPLLGPLMPPIVDGRAEPWSDTGSYWPPYLDLTDIDWLIAGGESGPRHRRFDPQWARDLRDACRVSGTAFFFKQHGGRLPTSGGRELDGRTYDELPAVAHA